MRVKSFGLAVLISLTFGTQNVPYAEADDFRYDGRRTGQDESSHVRSNDMRETSPGRDYRYRNPRPSPEETEETMPGPEYGIRYPLREKVYSSGHRARVNRVIPWYSTPVVLPERYRYVRCGSLRREAYVTQSKNIWRRYRNCIRRYYD